MRHGFRDEFNWSSVLKGAGIGLLGLSAAFALATFTPIGLMSIVGMKVALSGMAAGGLMTAVGMAIDPDRQAKKRYGRSFS